VGKIRRTGNFDGPREVLVDPVGLGTPGACVARMASRDYDQGELGTLSGLGVSSERRTRSSGDKPDGELKVNSVSTGGKRSSLQTVYGTPPGVAS
jgi:hypothetical protein